MKPYNCSCLEIAGMLKFTTFGKPISDCQSCNGTGYVTKKAKEKEKFYSLVQKIRESKFPDPNKFRKISQSEWFEIMETCSAKIFPHPYYDFLYTAWGFEKYIDYISQWFLRIKNN
jgi:alpha-galactosidase/6-phospho-beta-glucosidase family protein